MNTEYRNAHKPLYAKIKYCSTNPAKERTPVIENEWYPNIVLPPWLHYGTNAQLSFIDAKGNGPTWTCVYELQEFVHNWALGWKLKDLAEKYSITIDQVRTLADNLNKGRITSPLLYFAYKLWDNAPIVKPYIFIPNPIPPSKRGYIMPSFAFYKVPNVKGKEYEEGELFYCPQECNNTLLIGKILYSHLDNSYDYEFKGFLSDIERYGTNKQLYDIHEINPIFTNLSLLNTIERFKYAKLRSLFNYTYNTNNGSRYDVSPLVITLDPITSGKTVFTQCHVKLYKQIWIEEYIKRTMWDQVTEHSLCMFSNAVHDRSHRYIDSNTGVLSSGVYSHKRDYFSMPIPIRHHLFNIGVKGKYTEEFYSIDHTRLYPSLSKPQLVHPVFDYVLKLNNKHTIVPYTDEHCKINYVERIIEANGEILKLTPSQWDSLTRYMLLRV